MKNRKKLVRIENIGGVRAVEVARIAADLGLTVITEEPTNGSLGIKCVTGEQPAESAA